MIQDIKGQFDNQYNPNAVPNADDYVFAFNKGIGVKVLDDDIEIPTVAEMGAAAEDLIYLFSIDDKQFWLVRDGVDVSLPNGYNFESMRALRMCTDKCMAGMTANHLAMWYRSNKFCGKCGTPTEMDGKLRMLHCPNCNNEIFPRINPAVIVGVRDGNRILTSKYANRPQTGMALLAGFCEIGESAEETVHREVMEEVGLKVKNVEYFASQPWGFAGNLSIGYTCEVDGSTDITLDEEELAIAQFIDRDELPEPTNLTSLTATIMKAFKDGKW